MSSSFARHWRMLVLRGLVVTAFGVALVFWPGLDLGELLSLFGAFALLSGLLTLLDVAVDWRASPDVGTVLQGLIGVGAGGLALLSPGFTAAAALALIATWAILTGVLQAVSALTLPASFGGERLLGFGGVLSALLGAAFLIWPGLALGMLTVLLGACALLNGALLLALGSQMKIRHQELKNVSPTGVWS